MACHVAVGKLHTPQIAEGKLHCPPPEFPSQVEGPFPDQHHARNGENAKESSNGGGICKNDLQTKIIISTHQKDLSTSQGLQITWYMQECDLTDS